MTHPATTSGPAAGVGCTDAELRRVVQLLHAQGAVLVAVGHGRDEQSRRSAEAFTAVWQAGGGQIAAVVDWPPEAASWLRSATRLTGHQVDAWVIADHPHSFAPVASRLAADTDWDPARTVAFASLAGEDLSMRTGADLDGLHGATPEGRIWRIQDASLIEHKPRHAPHRESDAPQARLPREITPGAIHVPNWLSVGQQRDLVEHCRRWATGPAPMRHTRLPNGGVMSVQTVCLGWHWQPHRYTRIAEDTTGLPVTPLPDWLLDLGQRALADAHGTDSETSYRPDAALINLYDEHAHLGMHQDKDEKSDAPVVSLSIGDACIFRLGNTQTRSQPYTDLELRSGDLFVFGGPARLAYHGVPEILPGTADPATGMTHGRLNITLRATGLPG